MSLHSTLRSAHVLAKDGLDLGGALTGWAAGLVVGGLLDLIPAQALRVCANRDYDRAARRAECGLNDFESERDVLEPGELRHRFYCNRCGGGYYTGRHDCLRDRTRAEVLGPYTPHLSWGVDGATTESARDPVQLPPEFDTPTGLAALLRHHGVRVEFTPTDSAASATADSSHPFPPVGGDGPVAPSSPVPGATGHPSELADLIAEVLAGHMADADSRGIYCSPCNSKWDSWGAWRAHVSPLIAERIEKATPPAPFIQHRK